MREGIPITVNNEFSSDTQRFEDFFRHPEEAFDHSVGQALLPKLPVFDALRGLFNGGAAWARLRVACLLELAAQPQGRFSRDDVLRLFHAVLPEALDNVLKRLRELGLLVWDASQQDHRLTPLAQQVQALLAPLAAPPQEDEELSGLLVQVAGSQQLGLVDDARLQQLHAQLVRLHDDFAEAIASGSEARLRQAQPRFKRALTLVERAGEALSAIIQDSSGHPRLERAARALGQDQARLLSMASQLTRALQQADRQRVTLGGSGLTSSDVRHWLRHQSALHALLGEALSVGVKPVFVSQHELLDVAESEFERERPGAQLPAGLPPAAAADVGNLDIPGLPRQLGELIVALTGSTRDAAEERPVSEVVLGGRFADAAYRLQLLPLLGDVQAQALASQTGELARLPWRLELQPGWTEVQQGEVARVSAGRLRPDATPEPGAASLLAATPSSESLNLSE